MRRLKKNWKVLAYLAGFVAATAVLPASVAAWYVVAGFAWLVVWLVRNNDGSAKGDECPYGIGERNMSSLQFIRRFEGRL